MTRQQTKDEMENDKQERDRLCFHGDHGQIVICVGSSLNLPDLPEY